MNGRDDLRELMSKVRPYIAAYLESKGVTPGRNGKYKCINPAHEDRTPSAVLIPPESTTLYCHGCLNHYDIYRCASILEGFPSSGQEFITENVYKLADEFGVPYDPIQLSEDDLYRLQVRSLFTQAKNLLSGYTNGDHIREIYDWKLEDVGKFGIGTVDSWKDFLDKLAQSTGCTKAFIDRAGIRSQEFNEHVITFPISDHRGQVVGFGSRDSRWTPESNRYSKWTNTTNTPLFSKSSILYGMEAARHYTQIYIFEGYGDVLEARLHGLLNCVALCGTSFSYAQLGLLKNLGKREIILCLDTDSNNSGQEAVQKIVDDYFSGQEAFKVGILELPPGPDGSMDPRDFIKTKGIKEFKSLPIKDVYQWRMGMFEEGTAPDVICDVMLPLIMNEPRAYRREQHLKHLSDVTGVRLSALQWDYDKLQAEMDTAKKERIQREVETLNEKIRTADGRQTSALVKQSFRTIREIEEQVAGIETYANIETVDFIDELKREFANREEGLLGWHTGFDFWDTRVQGMPKKECIVSLTGQENIGKSALVANLSWNISTHPENAGVVALVMTIDDSRTQFLPRYISIDTDLPLNAVMHPKYYRMTQESLDKIDRSWRKLRSLVNTGVLNIKDTTHGATIMSAERWVQSTLARNPDAKILFFLDNFHKLVYKGGKEGKEKVDYHSEEMDRMSKSYGLTWVCTQEMRKHDPGHATAQDIMGSIQMAYDNNITIIMDQEAHRKKVTEETWPNPENPDDLLPQNSLRFEKNKFSGWKGTIKLNFWPDRSKFFETEADTGDDTPF